MWLGDHLPRFSESREPQQILHYLLANVGAQLSWSQRTLWPSPRLCHVPSPPKLSPGMEQLSGPRRLHENSKAALLKIRIPSAPRGADAGGWSGAWEPSLNPEGSTPHSAGPPATHPNPKQPWHQQSDTAHKNTTHPVNNELQTSNK